MKFRPSFKPYTLMILRDPRKSIVRLRVPAFLFLALPVLFLAISAAAYLNYSRAASLDQSVHELERLLKGQQYAYSTAISDRDETIGELQIELTELLRHAEEIDAKMEEIRHVKDELKKLVGLENVDSDINVEDGDFVQATIGGIGGSSRAVTREDTEQLIENARKQYQSIHNQVESLHEDIATTRELVVEQLSLLEHIPSIWPVDSRRITSHFGIRRDPFTGRVTVHNGIDIGASTGTPVYAAATGEVTHAESNPYNGKYIVIDHGNGIATWYMHLSSMEVAPGDQVQKGQLIGKVGSTGRSTGPHLHYEIVENSVSVNPRPYMNESRREE